MKRLMIFGLMLALSVGLAGCGGKTPGGEVEQPCEHEFSGWIQGDKTHYQICPLCGEKHDEEEHRYENIYGTTCVVKSNRPTMVYVTVPKDVGETVRLKEAWVFVTAERDTLRLAWSLQRDGTFGNGADLSVAEGGWLSYKIPDNFSNLDLYKFFRLEAKSADITVREIVFLGQKESGGDLILLNAEPVKMNGDTPNGLTDCQQLPGQRFACTVCGKERD